MAVYNPDSNQHSNGTDSEAIAPSYYSVHVFFSRTNGYSIPVKITDPSIASEDDIIKHCTDNNLFTEEGDGRYVDTIDEIDLREYNEMIK